MTVKTKPTEEVFAQNAHAKTFTYEDVLKASIEYFNGDKLAPTTWMNKYAMKDFNDNYVELNPEDMHRRMAKEFGRIW